MKQLVGEPGDDPALAPIRALRVKIPLPPEGDDEGAKIAALLAELDRKTGTDTCSTD